MIVAILIATVLYAGAWGRQSKKCYQISLLLMFLFVFFRNKNMSGTDYISYEIYFRNSPTLSGFYWNPLTYSSMYGYGWGYGLLNSLVKTVSDNYYALQIVDTFLVFALLIYVIYKLKINDNEKCMFLFVFFCTRFIWYFFILLRQNIANLICWIVLLGYDRNNQYNLKHLIKDIVLILIAYSFHQTTVIFVLAYLVYIIISQRDHSKYFPYLVTLVSVIITAVTSTLMPMIINVISGLSGDKYAGYIGTGGLNYINYALRVAYLFVIFYLEKNEKSSSLYLNGTAIAVMLGAVNSDISVRAADYFAISYYGGMGVIRENSGIFLQKILFPLIYAGYMVILLQYILVNNPALMQYTTWVHL